jgi:hypothetical protein
MGNDEMNIDELIEAEIRAAEAVDGWSFQCNHCGRLYGRTYDATGEDCESTSCQGTLGG